MDSMLIFFIVLALAAVASAVGLLVSRSAVYAALYLVINFASVAVFYLMLGAPFIALVQITVYPGEFGVLSIRDHAAGSREITERGIPAVAKTPGDRAVSSALFRSRIPASAESAVERSAAAT